MEFANDIFELMPSHKEHTTSFNGEDVLHIPTAKGTFLLAKENEIRDQYISARFFLMETEVRDIKYWLEEKSEKPEGKEQENNELIKLCISSKFYESALFFYNVIVDLSWTLTQSCVEYAVYSRDDNPVDTDSMLTIKEAFNALRKMESLTIEPISSDSPLKYLKKQSPKCANMIDLVTDFWQEFKETEVRKNYNFIKHRGKPMYAEIEKLQGPQLMSLTVFGEELPSSVRDVRRELYLTASINELCDFDDNTLYPYITQLFRMLETFVDPSPLIS